MAFIFPRDSSLLGLEVALEGRRVGSLVEQFTKIEFPSFFDEWACS